MKILVIAGLIAMAVVATPAQACPLNATEAYLLATWPSGTIALLEGMSAQELAAGWIEDLQKYQAQLAAGPWPDEDPAEFRCFLETIIERHQCNIYYLTTQGKTCW